MLPQGGGGGALWGPGSLRLRVLWSLSLRASHATARSPAVP